MNKTWAVVRLCLVVALLAGVLAAAPVSAEEGEPQHGMGVLLSPPGDYPILDTLVGAQALPVSVDLSTDLPPVGDQGVEPTCTLWAVGYYYKTLQEQRERSWGPTGNDHVFSPSFLYSLSAGCGTLQPVAIPTTLEVVRSRGAAPLSVFPVLFYSECRLPTEAELQAAQSFRSLSYGNLFMFQGRADISRLKAHLAGGDAFVLSVPVYDSFYFYHGRTPVIGVPAATERLWGHHAILIVGYDDSLGAFKLVNSWGMRWGNAGFAYLSYDFVQTKAWEAWAMVDGGAAVPVPTATPVVTATPQPTVTATPYPTSTPTVVPTATPRPSPSPTAVMATLVLQQGIKSYHGTTDTYIDSKQPATNYDSSKVLKISDDGSVAGLVRFDLSCFPASAVVLQATLEFYVDTASQSMMLAPYEVVRPWANREVDWRKARTNGPWGAPGCNDTASDRTAAPVSTQSLGPGRGWRALDVTPAVRHWVSNPANNLGLVLRGQGGTRAVFSLVSAENTSLSNHPKLTIKYRQ